MPAANQAGHPFEIVLSSGQFFDSVDLLFLSEALPQLQKKSEPSLYETLTLYGIRACYASASDLQDWKLSPADLAVPVTVLAPSALSGFIKNYSKVLNLS